MGETPSKPVQPYDALGAQLRAGTTAKGRQASQPVEQMAVFDHCAWLGGVLNKAYQPGQRMADLARLFPQEGSKFDLVRGAFTADDGTMVDTASSHYVLCLSVPASLDENKASPLEQAEAAARELLNLPTSAFVFTELGTDGDVHYGVRDLSKVKPFDPDWPFWGDTLAWWCDGQTVQLITTKVPGGPTQEVIMPSFDQNRYWFTPQPMKTPTNPKAGG